MFCIPDTRNLLRVPIEKKLNSRQHRYRTIAYDFEQYKDVLLLGFGVLFISGYFYMFFLMCTACSKLIVFLSIVSSFVLMFLISEMVPVELQRRVDKYCPKDLTNDLKCISHKMNFLKDLQLEHPMLYV